MLYDLFTPFFFIAIGLHIDPQLLTAAVVPGVILLVAAVLGKFIGTVAPAYRNLRLRTTGIFTAARKRDRQPAED